MDFHRFDLNRNSAVIAQTAAPSSGQKEGDLQFRAASFQNAIAEDAKLAVEELERRRRNPALGGRRELKPHFVVATRILAGRRARINYRNLLTFVGSRARQNYVSKLVVHGFVFSLIISDFEIETDPLFFYFRSVQMIILGKFIYRKY